MISPKKRMANIWYRKRQFCQKIIICTKSGKNPRKNTLNIYDKQNNTGFLGKNVDTLIHNMLNCNVVFK
jgi:hypothetical protein